eukprot:CAMPEP_0204311884 /NCGR_PEP_ID=MMETSP0469-20131031/2612_1 /ASSEMBLY_ACC=CAM_ASM_000384 /TAXON_ID=2969 /ORGANISM="Oxyrrhis marina" /LENGTH=55 /DNA_ID=CAMNT_0051291911 /DNA_START=248 /DNA_END=415 /DNA_ORIENTATION=+
MATDAVNDTLRNGMTVARTVVSRREITIFGCKRASARKPAILSQNGYGCCQRYAT